MRSVFHSRMRRIERMMRYPIEAQYEAFTQLLKVGANTDFGRRYEVDMVETVEDFQTHIPLSNYDSMGDYLCQMMDGEADVTARGEGLVHVSELSWTKRITRPSDVLSLDQEIEAIVLNISVEEQKISLGIRQLDENPWEAIENRFPVGTVISGAVRNLTPYGAFVALEEGIDGMIHVSDMSWTRKINHPSEVLKKGDVVEARVLNIDKENQRVSLGIKQLETDPWESIDARFKVGDLVSGTVAKIASFGAFVNLDGDIDGLIHISQLSEEHVERVKDVIKVGDDIKARVIKVDKVERRIGLSIKAVNYDPEQLRRETAAFETVRAGDMVGLEQAFNLAALQSEEWSPSQN